MKKHMLLLAVFVAAQLVLGVSQSTAQNIRSETVHFNSGTTGTTISASIKGDEIIDYLLSASVGQEMSVALDTTNPSNYFNIMPPDANAAMFMGANEGTDYSGVLPTTGEYTIRVYLMRNAARRNETADYNLVVSIGAQSDASPTPPPSGDFADGLSGGPDFWEVTGLSAGDALNLRADAGTGFDILARLPSGEIVENHGCKMVGDTRWCQVKRTESGMAGWVSGQYLREASVGAVQPQSPPKPQANGLTGNGETFSATGEIPCSDMIGQPTRSCVFGVVRTDVPGNASVWVGLSNGEERFIMFENGAPSFTNAQHTPTVEKSGDLNLISIGDERFEIPDAVVFGG